MGSLYIYVATSSRSLLYLCLTAYRSPARDQRQECTDQGRPRHEAMDAVRGDVQKVERPSGSRYYKQYDEANEDHYHRQADDESIPRTSNLSKRNLCRKPRWRRWWRTWTCLRISARHHNVRLLCCSRNCGHPPCRCIQGTFRCRFFSGPRRGKFFKPRLLGRRSRRTEVQVVHHQSRIFCRYNHLKQTK